MGTASSNPNVNYLTEFSGIKSWLLSLDHKRIGLLYFFSVQKKELAKIQI